MHTPLPNCKRLDTSAHTHSIDSIGVAMKGAAFAPHLLLFWLRTSRWLSEPGATRLPGASCLPGTACLRWPGGQGVRTALLSAM